jgi:glycosyltransferase involved in cell wall biosynthesis
MTFSEGGMVLISVVMPAYNTEPFLAEAIESILTQTHQDFELIMIDDGSTDRTLEIMRAYESSDHRIRVISQENLGVGFARNAGIAIARGEWIAAMDADDVMEPIRLERQLAFVNEHPDVAVTSNLVTFIDADGNVLGRNQRTLLTRKDLDMALQREVVLGLHHTLSRKTVIEAIGGYRQETWPAEDTDLWTRIAEAGFLVLVQPEHLTRYRIHDQSTVVRNTRRVQLTTTWAIRCALNRRSGLPEPTMEEFLAERQRMPFYRRWNAERKELGAALYKEARFAYSIGKLGRTVLLTIASSLLFPRYAPAAVWRVIVRPRLPWGQVEPPGTTPDAQYTTSSDIANEGGR